MGISASLFCSNDAEQQTLHRRISPTDVQIAGQMEYWNDLADYLKPNLKDRSSCAISTWIQGSYKFHTQIRPAKKGHEYDIDLGVYFDWPGTAESGPHDADDLKDMVQASLAAYAADNNTDALRVTSPKEYCSRIVFSPEFHIDVPAYHEADDVRSLASASNGFVDSDPWAIWDWWIACFEESERARARRMVRYFKMWAALKFNPKVETPPSSILLTVLIAKAYESVDLEGCSGDDEVLSGIIEQMVTQLDKNNSKKVANPVNDDEDLNRLGDDYDTFRDRLGEFLKVSQDALEADSLPTAVEIWSGAFEHFFPLPAEEELAKSITASGGAIVPVFIPDVEVTIRLPGGKSYVQKNAATNVPKDSYLDFRLVNYGQVPTNAFVKWVVRNEGVAAEAENDLGHFGGYGAEHLNEHAEYKGRHFMDVTVSSHSRIVGMRRIPVSVLNIGLAKRLPKRLFRNR